MKHVVKALRSRSLCKAYNVPELYDRVMSWGPYKRLKRAKKLRASLNKGRVECILKFGDSVIDVGPAFRKVWIEEE